MQEGVYVEECDYGEFKAQQLGQKDQHEDFIHQHHHHSLSSEYEESTQAAQWHRNDEPEYRNIKSCHNYQIQEAAFDHQQSVLPHAVHKFAPDSDKHKSRQSAPAKHQNLMPREIAYDVDEEEYDDIHVQPHQQRYRVQPPDHDPHHHENSKAAAMNSMEKSDQNDYDDTAIPQSSFAGCTTRYQPLLSRDNDYENSIEDYNSINASQQKDKRGFDDQEYQYVATKPRYKYRPSAK